MEELYAHEVKWEDGDEGVLRYVINEKFIPEIDLKSVLTAWGYDSQEADEELREFKKMYRCIRVADVNKWVTECSVPQYRTVKMHLVPINSIYWIFAYMEGRNDRKLQNIMTFIYTTLLTEIQKTCADMYFDVRSELSKYKDKNVGDKV